MKDDFNFVIAMRPLAFILLLLHVNFSMFIAQIDEKDVYDANFQQVRDINSLSDYIHYCFSKDGHHKKTKDSDDDNARYFHSLKPHFFVVQPTAIVKKDPLPYTHNSIPLQDEAKLASGFSNIQSPPPKA